MNSFFKKNIELLKRFVPRGGDLSSSISPQIKEKPTATGETTVQILNTLIHSSRDPVKEGKEFAKNVKPGSFICLYGFGLGYHVTPVMDRLGPEGFLLVIELNPDLLSAAMILRDQTYLLSRENFWLIFGREEKEVAGEISRQMARINENSSHDLNVLFHPPSFRCIPENFPNLANALDILLMERRFPAILGGLEEKNYSLNKKIVSQTPGIKTLKNLYPAQPGILVSAGPSLDNILPHLKRMGNKTILTCVDTALPILNQHGILPEYVFSLDPQEESFTYFREFLERPFKLVFTPTANTKVVHLHRGEKFVVFKEGHSLLKEEDLMHEKGSTLSGGSVSCLGLDCLIQFGCDPIILIGQDCAFTGKRNYSRYADINHQLMDRVTQGNTLAGNHLENTKLNKQVKVKDASGEEVSTNQSLYNYLRIIEKLAAINPQTKFYNLCSRGARIENVSPLGSINELIKILQTV